MHKENPSSPLRGKQFKIGETASATVSLVSGNQIRVSVAGIEAVVRRDNTFRQLAHDPRYTLYPGRELTVEVVLPNAIDSIPIVGIKHIEPFDRLGAIAVDKEVTGTVFKVVEYGVFVKLGYGLEGLVHRSEINWDQRSIVWPTLGETIRAKVIEVNTARGNSRPRVYLSIKRCLPDPWTLFLASASVGQVLTGKVSKFVGYGIFVRIFDSVYGLIHESELLNHTTLDELKLRLKVGSELAVEIIEVSPEKKRVALRLAGEPGL